MSEITAIRAQGFRSFVDTGWINLKPITILVGKNSIGKSSFARIWPLFRQSYSERKKAPVLWLGDLVDLGNFDAAHCRYSEDPATCFSFRIEGVDPTLSPGLVNRLMLQDRLICSVPVDVSIRLIKKSDGEGTLLGTLEFSVADNVIKVAFDTAGFLQEVRINNRQYHVQSGYSVYTPVTTGVLPEFYSYVVKVNDGKTHYEPSPINPLALGLYDKLRAIIHGNTLNSRVWKLVDQLKLICGNEDLLSYMKSQSNGLPSWKAFCRNMKVSDWHFMAIRDLILLQNVPLLVKHCNSALAQYFSSVRYIEPLRATAERYYRRQELAIDEIDSRGGNLVSYVDGLGYVDKINLNSWLSDKLSIKLHSTTVAGHRYLKVEDLQTDRTDNIADMGFGFSQIIPVAIQVWASTRRANMSYSRGGGIETIVIEQPELHLHPAMQARVGEMLLAIAKEANREKTTVRFVIETHSAHLISKIGDLIASDQGSPDAVSVLIFEQHASKDTKIKELSFNSDGQLRGWPYGFFEAS